MAKKREEPQLTVNKFRPLLELDEIDRGTKIFRKNDQKEVHWEYTSFTIIGVSEDALLCRDSNGRKIAFTWDSLPDHNFQVIVG